MPTPAGPARLLVQVKKGVTLSRARLVAQHVRRYADAANVDGVESSSSPLAFARLA